MLALLWYFDLVVCLDYFVGVCVRLLVLLIVLLV